MPYTTINKPSLYFNPVTYTGNGSTQSITSLEFSPDFVWLKKRNDVGSHNLFDSIRGATKWLLSNSTDAEGTTATSLTSFDANGFSLGSNASTNSNTNTFISWSWRGSDSSAVSNTAGTITSTVSANTTSGFSIVSYTGTGSNATVGHGLGVAPSMIILKSRTDSLADWRVYHASVGNTGYLELNTTGATTTSSTTWQNTTPTSTVFSIGTSGTVNLNTGNFIAYCFAEVKGYSRFGKYTGNGSTDGTFIYTGFKPAYVLIKRTDSANNWVIYDTARDTFNKTSKYIYANSSQAEVNDTVDYIDILSNGFKPRATWGGLNGSGGTYIYMCFASNPFVSSTLIPTTAR
jgi:hypothetical protein